MLIEVVDTRQRMSHDESMCPSNVFFLWMGLRKRLIAYIRRLTLELNGRHLIPTTLNKKDTRNPIKQS